MNEHTDRCPNEIDVHVGQRIRARRKFLGVSQQSLANELVLTFQQVQKYEKGTNRVSASKLYEVARFLKVPVNYFFEGLPESGAVTDEAMVVQKNVERYAGSSEGLELAQVMMALPDKTRRHFIDFAKGLSASEVFTAA